MSISGRFSTFNQLALSREVEVLQLIAEGQPNKQIAAELGVTFKTIRLEMKFKVAYERSHLASHSPSGSEEYRVLRPKRLPLSTWTVGCVLAQHQLKRRKSTAAWPMVAVQTRLRWDVCTTETEHDRRRPNRWRAGTTARNQTR